MNNSLKSPRGLALLGLMLGITIVLSWTPLGMVPLGAISATVTAIPTIITGIILGPLAGLIMGTSMGLLSMIHAIALPMSPLDPLFINPLVSVLPRMFIGVSAYYVFAGLNKIIKKNVARNTVSTFVAGAAGSLTNTALVFLMLYIVYAQEVVQKIGAPFKVILISVFTTNAIAEALIAAVITVPVAAAYFKFRKANQPA